MIWFLTIVGLIPVVGMAAEGHFANRDALYTMVGHLAIFGTALLTLIQSRKNGMKMDAAKAALDGKGNRDERYY